MAERRKEVMEWWSFLVKEIGVIRRKGSDILLWNGGLPTLWSVAEKRREPAVEEQNIGRKIPPLGFPDGHVVPRFHAAAFNSGCGVVTAAFCA